MYDGRDYINKKYPEIQLFSEFRQKIFNPETSPFNIGSNVSEMKKIAYKYGKETAKSVPLGYSNSESLVAFNHTTPNNTLPIIWGDRKWHPIYPRLSKDKIKQAKEIKEEVAFYYGIMKKSGIVFYNDENVVVQEGKKISYNSRKDHSLLCLLKLQIDGYELPSICQILGITKSEYDKISSYGKQKKLIDNFGKVSPRGHDFFQNLMKKVRGRRFIKKEKAIFEMKYVNYMPKSFGGVS